MSIKIVPEAEYIKEYGKPTWTGADYDNNVYIFIDDDGQIIGDCVLFNLDSNHNKRDGYRVVIDYFEMKEKSKGHGRLCAQILIDKYNSLSGESVACAIGFWLSMGAKFEDEDICDLTDVYGYSLEKFNIN